MYLNLLECKTVLEIYEKVKKLSQKPDGIQFNQVMMNIVLEAAMREQNTTYIIDALYSFIDIKK